MRPSPPEPTDATPRETTLRRALRGAPRLLFALAAACTLSAGIGLLLAIAGRRPHLALLLAPPALVLLGAAVLAVRSRRLP